jgi:type 1 glutamine amidotransferase
MLFTLTSFCFGARASQSSEVLIFGKTIRPVPHGEIIPTAGSALANYLTKNGMKSTFTQDTNVFTSANLVKYDAVILLDMSEGVLSDSNKSSLETYFKSGHGIAAIHASISAGKDWPWFQNLLGTKFVDHAHIQNGMVQAKDNADPFFTDIPKQWAQTDEWYNFTNQIDSNAEVLMLSDESTYAGGTMGKVHPIAWRRESQNGRFSYTAMGHAATLYTGDNSPFLKFLLHAVRWTAMGH